MAELFFHFFLLSVFSATAESVLLRFESVDGLEEVQLEGVSRKYFGKGNEEEFES